MNTSRRKVIDITANTEAAVTDEMLNPPKRVPPGPPPAVQPVAAPVAQTAPTEAAAAAPSADPTLKMLRTLEVTLAAWKVVLENPKTPEHARKTFTEKVLYLFAAKQELDPPPATPQQPAVEINGTSAVEASSG